MEAWAQELIHGTLEDLLEQEFKHFKMRLADVRPKIPKGRTEKLDRLQIANLMIQHYRPTKALEVAVLVLETMQQRNLSERLKVASQNAPIFASPPMSETSGQAAETATRDIRSYLTSLTAQLHDTLFSKSPELDSAGCRAAATQVDGQLIFNDCRNLKWVDWNGSIPDGAVSIVNQHLSRIDYVAKLCSCSGFYTPSKGPFCFYTLSDKELKSASFQILVNRGNFERLEWKEGSWGSVPLNAIRSDPRSDVFVGRNKYGLGKVVMKFNAFFLPSEGKEYCYKWYEVLTVCKDFNRDNISNVHYQMEEATVEYGDLSILDGCFMKNRNSLERTRSAIFQKEISSQHCWNIDHSVKPGVCLHFTGRYPITNSDNKGDIVLQETSQGEETMSFTKTEMRKVDENIVLPVLPNQACELVLQARKIHAHIPFHATVSRTYLDGQIHETTISGVYTIAGYDSVGIQVKGYHLLSD